MMDHPVPQDAWGLQQKGEFKRVFPATKGDRDLSSMQHQKFT
jgi:hypothetical protein